MPSVSQAQNRFMHAAAEGKIKGVSRKVGQDFVNADAGRKIKKLPERIAKAHKEGRISDTQAAKFLER